MKLSILLPFRDASPWLEETFHSILGQSMTDWEIVCVDDHSSDNSVEIVESFVKRDPRIQLIRSDERGIIPALQVALKRAKGAYITRMDADDRMPEKRLERMVNLLDALPARSIVTGKVRYFCTEEISQGYQVYAQWLNARVDLMDHFSQIYRECVIASPNWMGRRSDFKADRIFENLVYPEDYDMTFHWMQFGYTIHCVDAITLDWREHPARTSRNSDVYDQESFFELKINWFQKIHDLQKKTLGIMGAGRKGKLAARILSGKNQNFNWYDLNYENYLSQLQGKHIQDYRLVRDDLLLIAIYPENLDSLNAFLSSKGYIIGTNAWFL